MELPKIPQLGQASAQSSDPYALPQPGSSKKTVWLLLGGGILLIGLLLWLFLSGSGGQAGEAALKDSAKEVAASAGILEKYQDKLGSAGVKNDSALMLVILRGNLQRGADLYKKAFTVKTTIASAPKLEKADQDKLDQAERSNVLDDSILTTLKPRIATARQKLRQAKTEMNSKANIDAVTALQTDIDSVQSILDKVR